jgi:MSHA biogenesis protein MshP
MRNTYLKTRTQLCSFNKSKQQGSMLVIALFIIIALAILTLSMVRMLSASADSIVSEVYGQRALNAANSGLEQAKSGAFPLSGTSQCPATYSFTFSNTPGLLNCGYQSECDVVTVSDSSGDAEYYRFASQGTCFAGETVVSRDVMDDVLQ